MFRGRGVYGVIGTMLALVALFLVLDNHGGATALIDSIGNAGGNLLTTLQGRTPGGKRPAR
jgi:hypothetical protein